MEVGARASIELVLPSDYPIASARHSKVTFEVVVHSSTEVKLLPPSSPELLAKLGFGSTLTEVMRGLADQLIDEAAALAQARATQLALEELVKSAGVKVPPSIVDVEIGLLWKDVEGELLSAGATEEEQDQALHAWLNDSDTRRETEGRLATTLLVRAIAQREGLVVSDDAAEAELIALAESAGMNAKEVGPALAANPQQKARACEQLTHLRAVAHIMERVTIRVAPAPVA